MPYTFLNLSKPAEPRTRSYWKLWLVGIFAVLVACLLHWGGYVLVAKESLPTQVDAAVVLQGSTVSEKVRVSAAMDLLRQGAAGRVALSVPKESDWGQEIPAVARQYLEKNYGPDLAGRVDFYETPGEVSSAEQEAQVLTACIQEHGWKTIVLVTSNYDSRHAGMIWRKTLLQRDPSIRVSVDGVADPEYQPRGWWRQPLYAKTWLVEVTKLVRAI